MNKSFFSSREIYVRLTYIFPKKMAEYEPYTIMRWCAQVITEFVTDPSGMVEQTIELGIPENKSLQLPIGIYKIVRVYNQNDTTIPFTHQGDYLVFNDANLNDSISCDVLSFVIEDGFPLIKRGYEKACEAFCIYSMYQEDYMEGKINGQQWNDISQTKDWEIEAAARSWSEVDDNMVKKIMHASANRAYKKFV